MTEDAHLMPLTQSLCHYLVAPDELGCRVGSGFRISPVLADQVQDHLVVLGVVLCTHGQRCAQT